MPPTFMPRDAVGITTTLPIEIIAAAGRRPIDLNDLLASSPSPARLVELGERLGFPQTLCAWNRGNYAVVKEYGIRTVVVVGSGDCSTSQALGELLEADGIHVVWFGYPPSRSRRDMAVALKRLAREFGTSIESAERVRLRLRPLRAAALEVDRLAWQTGSVSAKDAEWALTSCSDFLGAPAEYRRRVSELLRRSKGGSPQRGGPAPRHRCGPPRERPSGHEPIRLGYIGVPSLIADLYGFIETNGARVVFHEMQRQFAMPGDSRDLVDQYLAYTYPYSLDSRIADINEQVELRRIQGLIHHVQSFCHRQAHDPIFRRRLSVPILTLETAGPGKVDGRLATRIMAFLEMLQTA
ncbi:MAG: 2-hydroxyacyl-CoA dehydratase [Planctomycetota bacterium]|nr:2-hydroxyacyl-CoA dehydratase [Planctomycetota bacterium]